MSWELLMGLFVGTAVSGVIPLVNAELLVVAAVAASASATGSTSSIGSMILLLGVVSAAGQMMTKSLLFGLARWAPSRMPARAQGALERASAKIERHGGASSSLLFVSAATGIPPFYGVSLAAGALHVRFQCFLAAGFAGRAIRFGGLAWAGSRLVGGALGLLLVFGVSASWVDAQLSPVSMPVVASTERGAGPRPAWATAEVPPAIWILAEAASEADDRDVARALLEEAEVEARVSADADPESVELRFGLAIVLGLRAEYEGGRTKVRAAAALHETLTAVLDQDPEHARAQHLLGRLHAGVRRMNRITRFIATRLLGGSMLGQASWKDAERYLAFAERSAPEVLDHHLQLALLYRDTSRPELAQIEVQHVLELEASSPMEQAVRREALQLRIAG